MSNVIGGRGVRRANEQKKEKNMLNNLNMTTLFLGAMLLAFCFTSQSPTLWAVQECIECEDEDGIAMRSVKTASGEMVTRGFFNCTACCNCYRISPPCVTQSCYSPRVSWCGSSCSCVGGSIGCYCW